MKRMLIKAYVIGMLSVAFVISSVIFTFAYLSTFSTDVKNDFSTDQQANLNIHETVMDNVKSDVYFENTSDYAVYVRVAIVTTWQNGDKIYGIPPVEGTDYQLILNTTDWIKIGDFYYYKSSVNAGNKTKDLIEECKKIGTSPTDYPTLSVEIVAQSIQALGNAGSELAVEEAWNVRVVDGKIVSSK